MLVKELIFIKRTVFITLIIIIALSLLIIGKPSYHTRTVYNAFNTVSQISVYSRTDNTLEYERFLHRLHSQLDSHSRDSLISRLNRGETVALSPEISGFLTECIDYSKDLSDYFDITVNPLVESWERAESEGRLPVDIEEKLELVGADGLLIKDNTAQLVRDGASVTLGATAKGYACNALADKMKADKIRSALIDLGGNILALGKKPDGSNWSVAVADPKNPAAPLVTLSVADCSIVTSGAYERSYEISGTRYNHILNPKTGIPSDSTIDSVTVITRDSLKADILSTAIFNAGKANAKSIAEQYGVDFLLVEEDFIYYTAGIADIITLNNDSYTLVCL